MIESKKLKILSYFFSAAFLIYNINYSIFLSGELHLSDHNPFSRDSKEKYLEKYLRLYDFFEYINKNTPENSVIYEAFTGGRSYYINRTFYADTTSLDRYLLELANNGATPEDYRKHFENLPNSDLKATHLLIRANSFIQTYTLLMVQEGYPDSLESANKIQGYINFINSLEILKENNGVYLFKL